MWRNLLDDFNSDYRCDALYECMENGDHSEIVIQFLRRVNTLPNPTAGFKCANLSNGYLLTALEACSKKQHTIALKYFNITLAFAPNNSTQMIKAYIDRSILFFNQSLYRACLADIEICSTLKCPPEMMEQLNSNKRECLKRVSFAESSPKLNVSEYSSVLELKTKRHPEIPFASTAVEVLKDKRHTIVAAEDIEVGTVLAVETSFVSDFNLMNEYNSCYYCYKMNLNLIPCETCSSALFCDQNCKDKCLQEYHAIECRVIEFIKYVLPLETKTILAFRATIKIRNLCETWEEFADVCSSMGQVSIKGKTINEIYGGEKYCLSTFREDKIVKFGFLYNCGFLTAILIIKLLEIPSYLPTEVTEKDAAVRAIAKHMMFYQMFVHVTDLEYIDTNVPYVHGFFPFIGKLKKKCISNVMAIGLNKEAALVAINPIKKGSKLIISYQCHYYLNAAPHNALFLYHQHGVICNCQACIEDWHIDNVSYNSKLSPEQKRCLSKVSKNIKKHNLKAGDSFRTTCKLLSLFSDKPHTREHVHFFNLFMLCIRSCQREFTKMKV